MQAAVAMTMIGPFISVLLCGVAAALAFAGVAPYGAANATSIAFGACAIVAMSQCFVLATRPRFLEPVFGGLDRMYRVHKWLGIAALALMIGHQLLEPHFKRWIRKTAIGDVAGEVGEFALYGFIGLILLSWLKRLPFALPEIPYHWWRLTHRLMGPLFAVVAFHQVFVDKPMPAGGLLSLYLDAFCVIGMAAYAYTELVAWRVGRRAFVVREVRRHGQTTEISLVPQGRDFRWTPGQFAFVSVPGAGLAEPHPFTIASAPASGEIRFAIKGLGDWTRKLPAVLQAGMTAIVEGPYGRFNFRTGHDRQVWLAGGIGITPFLAWAASLAPSDRMDIHLVYCVATPGDAVGLETLRKAAETYPRFTYDVIASNRDGRLTAAQLIRLSRFPVSDADLYFCGPDELKRCVLQGLTEMRQSPRHVHFELFEMR